MPQVEDCNIKFKISIIEGNQWGIPVIEPKTFEILLPIEQLNKGILLTAASIGKTCYCTCQFGCSLCTKRSRISSFKVLTRTSRFPLNL